MCLFWAKFSDKGGSGLDPPPLDPPMNIYIYKAVNCKLLFQIVFRKPIMNFEKKSQMIATWYKVYISQVNGTKSFWNALSLKQHLPGRRTLPTTLMSLLIQVKLTISLGYRFANTDRNPHCPEREKSIAVPKSIVVPKSIKLQLKVIEITCVFQARMQDFFSKGSPPGQKYLVKQKKKNK